MSYFVPFVIDFNQSILDEREREKKEPVLKVWAKSRLILRTAIWSDVTELDKSGENRFGLWRK